MKSSEEGGRIDADAQDLTLVVQQLREIHRMSGWRRICSIGELVLKELFGGSVANWRAGARERNRSLRRLAAAPDCPLRKSALADAIAVYVFVQENPAVRHLTNIAPGHVSLVHGRDRDEAVAVLRGADRCGMGVKALARSLMVGETARVKVRRTATAVLKDLRDIERRLRTLLEQLDVPNARAKLDEQQLHSSVLQIRKLLLDIQSVLCCPEQRTNCLPIEAEETRTLAAVHCRGARVANSESSELERT